MSILDEPIIKPSRWRIQHGPVKEAAEQVMDAAGNIGAPFRGLSTLEEWESRGKISKEMLDAANEFHRLFRLACLDPLHAADMGRVGGLPATGGHRGSIYAREEAHRAVAACGGQTSLPGSALWYIVGTECSIREWAQRQRLRGCLIDDKTAAGVLIGALGALQAYFGY